MMEAADRDYTKDTTNYYQMMVMHQDHGRTPSAHPVFDLGQFTPQDANKVANYMLALTQHLDLEMFEGNPANLVEAWGCLSYRCWLLPLSPSLPMLEINNEGIEEVPNYQDPR